MAESTARANVLNTVMVQSQGIMAGIDTLLQWTSDAESRLIHMKPISLHVETIAEQLEEFKVRFVYTLFSHTDSTVAGTYVTAVISSNDATALDQLSSRRTPYKSASLAVPPLGTKSITTTPCTVVVFVTLV